MRGSGRETTVSAAAPLNGRRSASRSRAGRAPVRGAGAGRAGWPVRKRDGAVGHVRGQRGSVVRASIANVRHRPRSGLRFALCSPCNGDDTCASRLRPTARTASRSDGAGCGPEYARVSARCEGTARVRLNSHPARGDRRPARAAVKRVVRASKGPSGISVVRGLSYEPGAGIQS